MTLDNKSLGNEVDIQEIIDHPYGGKTNIVLDATVFTAIMNCARYVDLRFNHNFVAIGGKSNSLECGSIVHTFMEFYYRNLMNGMSKAKAFGFAIAAAELYIQGCPHCSNFIATEQQSKPSCNHKPNQFPGTPNTPREPDTNNPREKYKIGWQWVLDTCDQYAMHYINDHWKTLLVEEVQSETLYEDDEIRILWKAKLDWLVDTNQYMAPVDHKTMKQRRDTLSLNNQFMGQCLVTNSSRVIINKIGFQKSLKPEEKFERKVLGYDIQRLIEWRTEILPYYAKLLLMYAETGHYPPNFTNCESKYGKCSFCSVCEANPDDRERVIKDSFTLGEEWNPSNEIEEND